MKKASINNQDIYLALLELRNTPINDELGSPAQRLMGRRTKTLMPTATKLLLPQTIKPDLVQKQLSQQKVLQKHYYDRNSRALPKLEEGESILYRSNANDTWKPARVTKCLKEPRSYQITTPDGQSFRRNRRHIRKCHFPKLDMTTHTYPDDSDCPPPPITNPEDGGTVNSTPPQAPNTTTPLTDISTNLRRSTRVTAKPDRYSDNWT